MPKTRSVRYWVLWPPAVLLSVLAIAHPAAAVDPAERLAGKDLLTITQYRALMERDVHHVRAALAVAERNWPAALKSAQASLDQERHAFGREYGGDEKTRTILWMSYLQMGELEAAKRFQPPKFPAAIASLLDDSGRREQFNRFITLMVEVLIETGLEPQNLAMAELARIEQLYKLAGELQALNHFPILSWSLAQAYDRHSDLTRAVIHARVAWRDGLAEAGDDWTKDEFVPMFGRSLVALLGRRATELERDNLWEDAIALRIEALGIATQLSDSVEVAKRALARSKRIAGMTAPERSRLAMADSLRDSIWNLVRQGDVQTALARTNEVRAIYVGLLGADSDDYAGSTKLSGFLHWKLGNYGDAFDRMLEAATVLIQTRGTADAFTKEAVADACVNALAHVRTADDAHQFANRIRDLEILVNQNFGQDHSLAAASAACRLHVERMAELTVEQRQGIAALKPVEFERNSLFQQGRYIEAEKLGQQIAEHYLSVLGEHDQLTHEALFSLAQIQTNADHWDAADISYRQLLKLSDREPFNRMPYFGDRLHWFAGLLQKRNQPREALQVLDRAKTVIAQATGDRSLPYAFALRIQGRVYLENLQQPALAHPILKESVEILAEIGRNVDFETAQGLTQLGECERSLGRYGQAESNLKAALQIRSRLTTPDPNQTAWNLNTLGRVYFDTGRYPQAIESFQKTIAIKEQHFPRAADLGAVYANLIQVCLKNKDHAAAERWRQSFYESRQQAWGEQDARFADDLLRLGSTLLSDNHGFYGRVSADQVSVIEPVLRQALQIRQHVYGENSWQYAEALQRVGNMEISRGRPSQAIPLLVEARQHALAAGDEKPLLAPLIASDLSLAYAQQGDYVRSLPIRLEANQGLRQVAGEDSAAWANSLILTSDLYAAMVDIDRAEDCIRQAVSVFESIGHRRGSECYERLARLYIQSGEYDRAEQYLHLVIRSRQETPLESSFADAATHITLARLYFARADYELVVSLARHALEVGGESGDPSTAIIFRDLLGRALVKLNQHEHAESELNEVLALRRGEYGPGHLDNLATYVALAESYERQGKFDLAMQWSLAAVDIALQHLDSVSTVLSERQQLLLRSRIAHTMDYYFSIALRRDVAALDIYAVALRWKGGVFARQRALKNVLRDADRNTLQIADELSAVNRQLATTVSNPTLGTPREWAAALKELTEQKELLEGKLSLLSSKLGTNSSSRNQEVAELRRRLPGGTVLVDFLKFASYSGGQSEESTRAERFLAFVITADQPIKVVELSHADAIESDIQQWRQAVNQSDPRQFFHVGSRLRAAVWTPFRGHIRPSDTVLISPDGALAQLAFGALPGESEQSFLLEEYRLAVIPVPQMLSELEPVDARESLDSSGTVLLVGDVEFDKLDTGPEREERELSYAKSAWAARSNGEGAITWPPLPGTRAEIEALGRTLREQIPGVNVRLLTESAATESALRQYSPETRWLHVATHGFFAQSENATIGKLSSASRSVGASVLGRESVPGFHPGLLSGLVMAGANGKASLGGDDGILTAIEVADLDLRNVEMTVLSACETGLGEVNSGEGVLGLQRALEIAGSRTVVASLWKVDDRATQKLMEEFYRNIWVKRLGKLDALRQAQLEMLSRYDTASGELRGDKRLRVAAKPQRFTVTPPSLWAAFVLSGDWR